ncbi:MAG: ABC transporter substrate-binding protein [Longimicrobiales bacterium]|nr:ABC transporter substrate-binding protein [Longimicrobiales bacterium]
MPRRFLPFLLLMALPGCSDRAADPALARGNTLSVLYTTSEWLFSPNHDDSPKFLMFEPLVTRATGRCSAIVGGVSEGWEPNANRTEWTFRLRPGVRWHDGAPMTSRDVTASLELWKHSDVQFYHGAPVTDWEALDASTVRVRLAQPGDWPLNTWDVIYPSHVIETLDPAGFYEWDFWTRPVGNGPFRYVRHEPGVFMELAANDDYYLGRPSIDGVVIQFQAGTGSGGMELRAGNVDIALLPPLDAKALADADPRFNHYYMLQATQQWLAFNYTHPVLREVAVRQALDHATDRDGLAAVLGLPAGLPLSAAPPGPCGLEGETLMRPRPFDFDRARSILSEAGWTDADGDGFREKGGRPLAFEILTHRAAENVAVYLADQWRRVGADVTLRTLEASVAHERLLAGEYDVIIPRGGDAAVRNAGPQSPFPTLDPDLAAALQAMLDAVGVEDGERLAAAAAPRFVELTPALALHARAEALVAHNRVQGLGEPGSVLETLGFRRPFGGLTKLWIENDADETYSASRDRNTIISQLRDGSKFERDRRLFGVAQVPRRTRVLRGL